MGFYAETNTFCTLLMNAKLYTFSYKANIIDNFAKKNPSRKIS